MSNPCQKIDFSTQYEKSAVKFLAEYDANICTGTGNDCVVPQIINQNFREDEISECIIQLKNYKSPGIDGIPSEFLRCVKVSLFRT